MINIMADILALWGLLLSYGASICLRLPTLRLPARPPFCGDVVNRVKGDIRGFEPISILDLKGSRTTDV